MNRELEDDDIVGVKPTAIPLPYFIVSISNAEFDFDAEGEIF